MVKRRCLSRELRTQTQVLFNLCYCSGEGEKRGRETGKKLPEDPEEAGQGIAILYRVF